MSESVGADLAGDKQSGAARNEQPETAHFWVCSSPFFETTLLSTSLAGSGETGGFECRPSTLRFFDADGMLVNEASVSLAPGKVSALELDPLMGACKFESGMKHAHLEVLSYQPARHICRIHSREGASMLACLTPIAGTRRAFFPVLFARDRLSFMPLVNFSESEAVVRARLFCGNRSPEAAWTIAPHATRIINLSGEFQDYCDVEESGRAQAYLRLGVRGDYAVGIQLIERIKGPNEGNLFSGLS